MEIELSGVEFVVVVVVVVQLSEDQLTAEKWHPRVTTNNITAVFKRRMTFRFFDAEALVALKLQNFFSIKMEIKEDNTQM